MKAARDAEVRVWGRRSPQRSHGGDTPPTATSTGPRRRSATRGVGRWFAGARRRWSLHPGARRGRSWSWASGTDREHPPGLGCRSGGNPSISDLIRLTNLMPTTLFATTRVLASRAGTGPTSTLPFPTCRPPHFLFVKGPQGCTPTQPVSHFSSCQELRRGAARAWGNEPPMPSSW